MKVSAIHASELVELVFLTVLALCFQQVRVLFVTLDWRRGEAGGGGEREEEEEETEEELKEEEEREEEE